MNETARRSNISRLDKSELGPRVKLNSSSRLRKATPLAQPSRIEEQVWVYETGCPLPYENHAKNTKNSQRKYSSNPRYNIQKMQPISGTERAKLSTRKKRH